MFGIGFIVMLGVWHLVNWVLTKAAVVIACGLFNLAWADKFWLVYLMVFMLTTLTTSIKFLKKSGGCKC